MDDERRQHQEARTFRVIAEMLDEPNRVDFPDLPLALDGAEVEREKCGVALSFARNPLGHAPTMDKWLASLASERWPVELAARPRGAGAP